MGPQGGQFGGPGRPPGAGGMAGPRGPTPQGQYFDAQGAGVQRKGPGGPQMRFQSQPPRGTQPGGAAPPFGGNQGAPSPHQGISFGGMNFAGGGPPQGRVQQGANSPAAMAAAANHHLNQVRSPPGGAQVRSPAMAGGGGQYMGGMGPGDMGPGGVQMDGVGPPNQPNPPQDSRQ